MQNHQTQIPQNVLDYLHGACDGGCGEFFPVECLDALLSPGAHYHGGQIWRAKIRHYLESAVKAEAADGEGFTGAQDALQWFLSAARLEASGTARDRAAVSISP